MKVNNIQSIFQPLMYHWTFLFIWLSWALYQWFHLSGVGLIILLTLTVRLWTLPIPFRKGWIILISIFLLLVGVDTYREKQIPSVLPSNIEGVLRTDPFDLVVDETDIKGVGLLYLPKEKPLKVRFYMTLDQKEPWLEDIHYVRVTGEITRPNKARNFYVFDYRNYLKTQRIYWQLDVEEQSFVSFNGSTKDHWDRLKVRLLRPLLQVEDNLWLGWMKKLLFNMNSTYYTQFQEDLSYLGIVHFFAISGFHIQYFSKYVRYLLLRMGVEIRRAEQLMVFIFVIYGWLIGWPIGAMRAIGGLIVSTFFSSKIIPLSKKDRLGLVGIGSLMLNIRMVSSLGFLLSFLMTYLILFYQQQLNKRIKPTPSWLSTIEMTAMCLFFSWPILLHHYFEWHPYQLILIILIAYIFEWVWMPLMVITCMSYYILPMNVLQWTTLMSHNLNYYWVLSLDWLRMYFKPLIIGRQGLLYYVGLFLIAGIWLYLLQYSRKKAYRFYLPCLCLWIFVLPHIRWSSQLTVLDVGQGDALLYQPAWSKEHWLIDTGGRLNWKALNEGGENEPKISLTHQQKVLVPALKALGAHRLTGVVVTHADIDHMGNLYQLDRHLPIERVFYSQHASQDDFFNQVLKTLDPKTQLITLNNSDQLSTSSFSLFQLEYGGNYMQMEDNDASLLAYFQMGPYGFLNMGDLSSDYERFLIEQYPHLNVTGLKLGHHGSQTSTSEAFLKHYQPLAAYISAGVNNRYNHPHQEVLTKLHHEKILYWSTIEHGAIRWRYSWIGGLKIDYALDETSTN
ncbi:hypothetical protein CJ205_05430 [Dolosicoccus paucivorans]|uniref:DNA internalization-related competence protein ComEC/Rec2 n=2 Tax=Dolosicoccus paucivorans TaxID=84521 RepID=A0A2N6SME0_9LACT|nr:hypothetical protein CJ206_03170 [Dolosicoccus paucivorans]PMC58233.1 hypothetical protein CJ205_05430 [Dolosicoccus paucivorans]